VLHCIFSLSYHSVSPVTNCRFLVQNLVQQNIGETC